MAMHIYDNNQVCTSLFLLIKIILQQSKNIVVMAWHNGMHRRGWPTEGAYGTSSNCGSEKKSY